MKLEVHERVTLVSLLPKEEDYAALKAIRQFKESISFTPSEIEFYELKTVTNSAGEPVTQWNAQKASEQIKEIPISEYMTSLVRKRLVAMEGKKQLKDELVSLYEKFVVMYR